MKKIAIVSLLILLIVSGRINGQITGAVVTGSHNVGSVLTAGSTGSPEAGNYVAYEWYYTPAAFIVSATTYTIISSDQTKSIYLKAIEKKTSDNSEVRSFTTTPVVVNSYPVASNVLIAGDPRSGLSVYGFYAYSDVDGNAESVTETAFKWYTGTSDTGTDPVLIPDANLKSYRISDDDTLKYIGFSVAPAASSGSTPGPEVITVSWAGPVINDAPVATNPVIIDPGTLNVNDVLTGEYEYSDTEGDIEGNSVYRWRRSPDNNIANSGSIDGAVGRAYSISLADTGKFLFFRVKPVAKTGRINGLAKTSPAMGRVNTPPYASGVTVPVNAVVGAELTATYTYHDGDGDDEGATILRWLRDGAEITGAVTRKYTPTLDDEGKVLTFEVTPVALTGYPDHGATVLSNPTNPVADNSAGVPVASNVCIDGKFAEGQTLRGDYDYTFGKSEGATTFRWLRNGIEISGATSDIYTVQQSDINQELKFEVTPRSSHSTPKVGVPVLSEPMARITMVKDHFLVTDKDTILIAEPPGGYFWGDGVLNGKFKPGSVDPKNSPFTINYQYSTFACQQKATKEIFVSDVKAVFDGFDDRYCQNGGYDTITVKFIPPGLNTRGIYVLDQYGYEFLDATVGRLNDSTIIIDPSKMQPGNNLYILYFYAINWSNYQYVVIDRPFLVEAVPAVSIVNKDEISVVCNNEPPIELYGSPPGGDFTGPVSGSYLNPALALGDTSVTYTYTTQLLCVTSVTVPVRINPAPVVAFAPADSCIQSSSDTTKFRNLTASADTVSTWLWEFSDAGGSSTRSEFEPGYLYKTGGFHKITLTATTVKNCSDTLEKTIDLGVKPLADFYWENECLHPSDSLRLFDATVSSSVIASRSWNFFDGGPLLTKKNPKYPHISAGYLDIEYIVRTNYRMCHDTVSKSIYVRPTIDSLFADDYFEDFEKGKGSWVKDYEARNSWSFGTPDRNTIKYAASGDSAWYTDYNYSTQKPENSAIISPCFDFTGLDRPMIRMMLWKRFDRNRDGAALQYKIGDSPGWEYVGTLDDGINWYNSTLIKGRPGGDQVGWTQPLLPETRWSEARHKLDELTGKKDVKFRIVYGSDGTSQDNDGIAFDDIWIGSRTRGVLLEHFSNNSSASSGNATAAITDFVKRSAEDVINIQYHTNFPGTDPYYDANPGDASARILFYGLSRAPYTFIDGGTRRDFANTFDHFPGPNLDTNDVIRRSLMNPLFKVNISATVAGGILSVTGNLKALHDSAVTNLTMYIAVTQLKSIGPAGALGETEYFNVFRKFMPDGGGIPLDKNWTKDETYDLTEKTWTISKIPNSSDIEIIIFLQNNLTKEVYQAESIIKPNIAVGIDNIFGRGMKGFSLYPNPASDKLSVKLENVLSAEAEIRIYDFSGTLVAAYKAGAGSDEYVIENLSLRSGIYLVRISEGGLDLGYKKLVVSER